MPWQRARLPAHYRCCRLVGYVSPEIACGSDVVMLSRTLDMAVWCRRGVARPTQLDRLWQRLSSSAAETVVRRRIGKLVVANRGEIACRVMRTARRLGVRTVALYSDADRGALHVRMADEAYHIGPAAATESYLRADRVLAAAKAAGADAVHPGYGFLSESAEFSARCRDEGVIFVGPPPSAIRDMGIKSTSKALMWAAGVPVVAGYHGDDQSDERLRAEARAVGFPLMIKAVRGGGGKGMRIASAEREFDAQLAAARREAAAAFGDDSVLLEQYILKSRHVEVQVFADRHGNAVHLFERDCSVQRRHQKTIEEAPAPGLGEATRAELGAAAVRAARAVRYEGAGTVEFILDTDTHAFHFCEMNTRLQVEHPVTEMIAGVDLVEWQLLVAGGAPLPLAQNQLERRGHAFECRVYAEEPRADFLPRAGVLRRLRAPSGVEHVRVESGVREGDTVSVHYDPMIAKLVAWGPDRDAALARIEAQLAHFEVGGVETNVEFLQRVCAAPAFRAGDVHTDFIRQHRDLLLPAPALPRTRALRAAVALILVRDVDATAPRQAAWRPNYDHTRTVTFMHHGQEVSVEVVRAGRDEGAWRARLAGEATWSDVRAVLEPDAAGGRVLRADVDGRETTAPIALIDDHLYLYDREVGGATCVHAGGRRERGRGAGDAAETAGAAPTAGVVSRVLVAAGESVNAGQPLFVLVAMKMEYTVRAPRDGLVLSAAAELEGEPVARGVQVVTLEPKEEAQK